MTYRSKELLSVGADAKTIKSLEQGVLTGILYLAPHDISGYQVCAKASEGCKQACLYTSGKGKMNFVQQSRINKTKWFFEDRESFMQTLVKNIKSLIRKAAREGLKPAVRLNGTSDLPWEKFRVVIDGVTYRNLMVAFPEVAFYDYTKILGRYYALGDGLPNYHLTFSLAEDNDADARRALREGYNLAVVMRLKKKDAKPEIWSGYPVIDGDKYDARFIDPKSGHIVALFAKGDGVKDTSGFVRDVNSELAAETISLKIAA